MTNFLTYTQKYADNQTYATAQGSGHLGLCGPVRREAPCAAGQGENVRTRTVRTDRNSQKYALQLGSGDKFPADECLPETCPSLENQGSNALSRGIENNFSRIFQKTLKFGVFPVAIPEFQGIIGPMNGNYPNQKRSYKELPLSARPVNQPNVTRLIASRNSTLIGILDKPSIASPGGRTLT